MEFNTYKWFIFFVTFFTYASLYATRIAWSYSKSKF